MITKQKIMAFGPHADDIEADAGGTLLKYRAAGYEIVYVMTTNNMSGNNQVVQEDGSIVKTKEPPGDTERRRKRECAAAAAMVDAVPIHLDFPQRHCHGADGGTLELRYGCPRPDNVPADVPSILTAYEDKASLDKIVDLILEHDPACIITKGIATGNIEHFATALLTVKAFWKAVDKGFRGALIQAREDTSCFGNINTRFDTYVDISDYLDKKMEMLWMHRSQMPTALDPDHGHRLRALKRGIVCGCRAAEVFTWVRRYDIPDLDGTHKTFSPLIYELEIHTGTC